MSEDAENANLAIYPFTDQEIMDCVASRTFQNKDATCALWDPENQPSVMANIEKDLHFYDDRQVLWVYNGTYYGWASGRIPLSSEVLLCKTHEDPNFTTNAQDTTSTQTNA